MNEKLCRHVVSLRALQFDPGLPLAEWACCEGCGEWTRTPEMHHRRYRSRGGLWIPSNILQLCKTCHDGAGGEKLWARQRGWNVHSWEDPLEVPVMLWHTGGPLWLDDVGGFSDISPLDKD